MSWLEHFKTLLIGGFGALIAVWVRRKEYQTIKDQLFFFIAGVGAAQFITPLVLDILERPAQGRTALALSFVIGASGGSLIVMAIHSIKRFDPWQFIIAWRGGGSLPESKPEKGDDHASD
jgi:hypothetical protein